MGDSFIEDLRRPRPDPGGGAAAAHGALLALALAEKIVLIEQGRASRAGVEPEGWERLHRQAMGLKDRFTSLRGEDVRAYEQLAEALRSRGDEDRLRQALDVAIQCPLSIMRGSREALELVEAAGSRCRLFLVADVLVACELLGAALRSAHHIAVANLPLLDDRSSREKWGGALADELHRGVERLDEVRRSLEVRHATGG
jgi:formiminotetrahydrofolate cyclodeaminase